MFSFYSFLNKSPVYVGLDLFHWFCLTFSFFHLHFLLQFLWLLQLLYLFSSVFSPLQSAVYVELLLDPASFSLSPPITFFFILFLWILNWHFSDIFEYSHSFSAVSNLLFRTLHSTNCLKHQPLHLKAFVCPFHDMRAHSSHRICQCSLKSQWKHERCFLASAVSDNDFMSLFTVFTLF